jgi:hypothetical protein
MAEDHFAFVYQVVSMSMWTWADSKWRWGPNFYKSSWARDALRACCNVLSDILIMIGTG